MSFVASSSGSQNESQRKISHDNILMTHTNNILNNIVRSNGFKVFEYSISNYIKDGSIQDKIFDINKSVASLYMSMHKIIKYNNILFNFMLNNMYSFIFFKGII